MRKTDILTVVVFCITLLSFGFLAGAITTSSLPDGNMFSAISAIGSFLSGLGAVCGVGVALYVGIQWRSQYRTNIFVNYYEKINALLFNLVSHSALLQRVIESEYNGSKGITEHSDNTLIKLEDEYDELTNELKREFSKLELLYSDKDIRDIKPIPYLKALNCYNRVRLDARKTEPDFESYLHKVNIERNKCKVLHDKYKSKVSQLINKI
ncbi:hypothetical protein [Vibrio jasicida]|uniref:hypothetical protein n=1 Tax=Vibrio jasicida TaxID=766224 RepID=UPI0015E2E7EC|nr:hypothetical protein [Vibrio jasicida]